MLPGPNITGQVGPYYIRSRCYGGIFILARNRSLYILTIGPLRDGEFLTESVLTVGILLAPRHG